MRSSEGQTSDRAGNYARVANSIIPSAAEAAGHSRSFDPEPPTDAYFIGAKWWSSAQFATWVPI